MRALSLILLLLFSGQAFSDIGVGDVPYANMGRSSDGQKVNLEELKGKVVIVTFWATWCGPCMKEIPMLSSIQKKVGTDDLQVIAISYHESKKLFRQVSKALEDNPMIFSFDKNSKIAKKYGVESIPHMVIVGRDGLVKAKHIGYSESSLPGFIEEINTLLSTP